MTTNIGEIIRFRRERCGLSQRKLADLSYVHRKTISYIEIGKITKPHASTIDLLFETLDKQEAAMTKRAVELGV